jgi:hypothetical protein
MKGEAPFDTATYSDEEEDGGDHHSQLDSSTDLDHVSVGASGGGFDRRGNGAGDDDESVQIDDPPRSIKGVSPTRRRFYEASKVIANDNDEDGMVFNMTVESHDQSAQ